MPKFEACHKAAIGRTLQEGAPIASLLHTLKGAMHCRSGKGCGLKAQCRGLSQLLGAASQCVLWTGILVPELTVFVTQVKELHHLQSPEHCALSMHCVKEK